jgi:hypothetical protein
MILARNLRSNPYWEPTPEAMKSQDMPQLRQLTKTRRDDGANHWGQFSSGGDELYETLDGNFKIINE